MDAKVLQEGKALLETWRRGQRQYQYAAYVEWLFKHGGELIADAGRYSWLRENGNCHGKLNSRAVIPADAGNRSTKLAFRYWCKAAEADAAIDTAIAAGEKTK